MVTIIDNMSSYKLTIEVALALMVEKSTNDLKCKGSNSAANVSNRNKMRKEKKSSKTNLTFDYNVV